MHGRNVYHRDIKADNVLIHQLPSRSVLGRFKVGDFGIASHKKVGGTCLGTPGAQCQLGGRLIAAVSDLRPWA